jgi:hypothetical protein
VYSADALRVIAGANLGDGIGLMEELDLDDIYALSPGVQGQSLSLQACSDGTFLIANESTTGTPLNALHLDAVLSFMSPDGQTNEVLVLVEVDETGLIEGLHLLPLVPLQVKTEYTLLGMDRDSAARKLAQLATVSFTRGTRITLATGEQKPIEDLKIGDRVLTRDDGVQPIRWIGQTTVRATGEMAPILIRAGVLNNSGDLLVSPDHRLFVYQRNDRIGVGNAELLVKARHLVNGHTVVAQDGGFVDYFQLLFDHHHIVYAEGIAAETLLLDSASKPAIPEELLEKLANTRHGLREDHGIEVQRTLLDRPDAIELLRRASGR